MVLQYFEQPLLYIQRFTFRDSQSPYLKLTKHGKISKYIIKQNKYENLESLKKRERDKNKIVRISNTFVKH